MDRENVRWISLLACGMTAGLPALAGMLVFRAQPILVAAIQGDPKELGWLTDLFFNHAGAALLALLAAGFALFVASFLQLRKGSDVERLANQLGLLCASALLSVLFAALFTLAAALPLYARLTER
jgi:hypothetical protein